MILEIIITIFVLIICFCLIRGIYETYVLKISHEALGHKLEDNSESGKFRSKIRVFLFSDIHTSFLNISASTVAYEISKSGADVILFAGDMVNKGTPNEILKLEKFFKTICESAKKHNIPIYAVCGNHDTKNLAVNLMDTKGIDNLHFLFNNSVTINSSDNSIWQITGLEDIKNGNPDYITAHGNFISDSKSEDELPEIILSHNPDSIYTLPFISDLDAKIPSSKFLLSGHFHGGQIWMPFGLEYRILRKEKMAAKGYRRGAFKYKSLEGYITRGLGCVVVPLRFFSYPEVAILDINT